MCHVCRAVMLHDWSSQLLMILTQHESKSIFFDSVTLIIDPWITLGLDSGIEVCLDGLLIDQCCPKIS